MGEEPEQIRNEIEGTRSDMTDTVDALAQKADVKGRVKDSLSDTKDRIQDQFRGTGDSIGEATPSGEDVKQTARKAAGVAQENPIGLAIGGLAAGFLVGMALPSTRVEDEKIGPMADEFKDRARETGQEVIERGKEVGAQVAEDAVETAKQATQEQAAAATA